VLDSVLGSVIGVELMKVFTSGRGECSFDIELKDFTNMFYLLKNLLYLNLLILKLMCNNLIFNETMILYVSYVCLLHSCFTENHPISILEDRPLISEVVLSQRLPRDYGQRPLKPSHQGPPHQHGGSCQSAFP
jgi:hypothetical protein